MSIRLLCVHRTHGAVDASPARVADRCTGQENHPTDFTTRCWIRITKVRKWDYGLAMFKTTPAAVSHGRHSSMNDSCPAVILQVREKLEQKYPAVSQPSSWPTSCAPSLHVSETFSWLLRSLRGRSLLLQGRHLRWKRQLEPRQPWQRQGRELYRGTFSLISFLSMRAYRITPVNRPAAHQAASKPGHTI
jgi:hypothetical protein